MKTTKMSLANIQGKLSRAEMKNIMAGSGPAGCLGEYDYDCDPTGTGEYTEFCCPGLHCEGNASGTGTICMAN